MTGGPSAAASPRSRSPASAPPRPSPPTPTDNPPAPQRPCAPPAHEAPAGNYFLHVPRPHLPLTRRSPRKHRGGSDTRIGQAATKIGPQWSRSSWKRITRPDLMPEHQDRYASMEPLLMEADHDSYLSSDLKIARSPQWSRSSWKRITRRAEATGGDPASMEPLLMEADHDSTDRAAGKGLGASMEPLLMEADHAAPAFPCQHHRGAASMEPLLMEADHLNHYPFSHNHLPGLNGAAPHGSGSRDRCGANRWRTVVPQWSRSSWKRITGVLRYRVGMPGAASMEPLLMEADHGAGRRGSLLGGGQPQWSRSSWKRITAVRHGRAVRVALASMEPLLMEADHLAGLELPAVAVDASMEPLLMEADHQEVPSWPPSPRVASMEPLLMEADHYDQLKAESDATGSLNGAAPHGSGSRPVHGDNHAVGRASMEPLLMEADHLGRFRVRTGPRALPQWSRSSWKRITGLVSTPTASCQCLNGAAPHGSGSHAVALFIAWADYQRASMEPLLMEADHVVRRVRRAYAPARPQWSRSSWKRITGHVPVSRFAAGDASMEPLLMEADHTSVDRVPSVVQEPQWSRSSWKRITPPELLITVMHDQASMEPLLMEADHHLLFEVDAAEVVRASMEPLLMEADHESWATPTQPFA